MSSPVSSSKTALMTALIIALGKRHWERAFGVAFSWATSAQASMAFWMGERCRVLLRVLCAGALSSSSCGEAGCAARCACRRGERRGAVAWATLGTGATLGAGATLGGADYAACWACSRGEQRGVVAWATLGAGATLGTGATLGGARRGAVGVRKGKTRGESIVEGRSVLCAVCGLEMKTLRGRRGGTNQLCYTN